MLSLPYLKVGHKRKNHPSVTPEEIEMGNIRQASLDRGSTEEGGSHEYTHFAAGLVAWASGSQPVGNCISYRGASSDRGLLDPEKAEIEGKG
jgi:hypothetical protein